jgi:hypothetical protein
MPQPMPQVIVEAAFTPATPALDASALILDDPVKGLLDTGTLGPGDWVNIGGYIGTVPIVQDVTITRPSTRQQGPLVSYDAATCTITLANSDGRFSPEDLAGPYVTGGVSQVRPMIPVRVRAIWNGQPYPLFSGYARSWTPPTATYGPDYDVTVLSAQDGFCVLEGVTVPAVAGAGAGEMTGARVNRILAAAGWYDAALGMSRVDPGQSQVQAAAGGDTALGLLRVTADSEIGDLYVNGAGQVTFRDRNAPLTDPRATAPQGVFGDWAGVTHPAGPELPYADLTRPDDDTTMANDIQATITGSSNMQQVKDTASIAKYLFPRSYARSDLILLSDSDAHDWAGYVLAISRGDESRFDQLTLTGDTDPASLYPHILGREIGDRIQVWRRPPGVLDTTAPWSFTNAGTPLSASYFIVAAAAAAQITPGDGFAVYLTGGTAVKEPGPFTITSVSDPFAGFCNVFFAPPAAAIISGTDVLTQVTGAIVKDCFIRSITHTVTVDGWQAVWGLQDAARYTFMVLDSAALGQLSVSALGF